MKTKLLKTCVTFIILMVTPVMSVGQINTLKLADGTLFWGSYNYGPAVKMFWWNIDQCKGIYWQNGSSSSYDSKHLKLTTVLGNPMISGTRDSIDFRNGNLYEDLYMKNLILHYSYNGYQQLQKSATSNALSLLQPVAIEAVNSQKAYALSPKGIEKALPDALLTDENGKVGIDYGTLLPVLLQRIDELQKQISHQQAVLDSLQASGSMPSAKARLSMQKKSGMPTLAFTIPKTATSACVQLCDSLGRQLKMVDVLENKKLILSEDDKQNGTALYSLIIDGSLVETRKIQF